MNKTWIIIAVLLVASVSGPNFASATTWVNATSSAEWSPRWGFSALDFNVSMWVMGGYNGYGGMNNDVWNSANGVSWIEVTSNANWQSRSLSSQVVFNGRMWLLGGSDNSYAMKNDVWSSSDGLTWIEATDNASWPPRREQSSVMFDNKIWVVGGLNSSYSSLSDVWSSGDGIAWIEATDNASWTPRSSASVVVFDNKIWIMGGYFTDDIGNVVGTLNDVWSSSDGIAWIEATSNASWTPRSASSVVVFEGKMWLLGGSENDGTNLNDVWSSSDGLTWTQDSLANWIPRGIHASLVSNNEMWVMGGADANYNPLNDVWHSVCVPSWACNQFATCNSGNVVECLSVADTHACNVSFTGNASTYNAPSNGNLLSVCMVAGASVFTNEGVFMILLLLIGFGFLFVKKPVWAGLVFILWVLMYNKNMIIGLILFLFSIILIYQGWRTKKG